MAKTLYTPRGLSLKERLAIRSKPGPNGCVDYVGNISQGGYGLIHADGKMLRAHRASWTAHKGPIPKGLKVLHSCDRRICINVKHLRIGTQADNGRDMAVRGRSPWTKLTVEQVYHIRTDARAQRAIAKDYGVSQVAIGLIKRRKNWKHLD